MPHVSGQPLSGCRISDDELLPKLRDALPPYLRLADSTFIAGRRRRLIRTTCTLCGQVMDKHVSNVKQGIGLGCRCQMKGKYGLDPRALVLGERYDSMVQRCKPGKYMSKNYGDRGIRLLFKNREHFIRWALENLPHESYRNVQIDRINNNGHYEPGNLRLVTPSQNMSNTRRNQYVRYMGQRVVRQHAWHLIKTDYPDFPFSQAWTVKLFRRGFTAREVLKMTHSGKGRRCMTFSTPDPAIVSLYRDI